MKQIKTIEKIAAILLKYKISFTYTIGMLVVTDQDFAGEVFANACYHSDTKRLVLSDSYMRNEISQYALEFYIKTKNK